LPSADEALVSLGEKLRQDVSRLAVDIGERNLWNRPRELAQAAEWIEAKFRGCRSEPPVNTGIIPIVVPEFSAMASGYLSL
jgi:hypothetical protein